MNKSRNTGMSSFSLLALVLIVVFFGMCAFKVTPLYYDNIMLKTTLEGIDNPVGTIDNLTNAEIRDALQKTFAINSIGLDHRDVDISRENNRTTIGYVYESRAELFFNISVIADFDTQYPEAP